MAALLLCLGVHHALGDELRDEAAGAIRRATSYFAGEVAVRGGYVYFYSPDLRERWGEGRAAPDEIYVQPPATPTVGVALLDAYRATGDEAILRAALAAGRALAEGRLPSGGWRQSIRFSGPPPKNFSSLDDGQTQSALYFLTLLDHATGFSDPAVHQAATEGLDALLAAQFPNGAFPQGWAGPAGDQPILPASYPDYDWRTKNRVKEYWHLYTLNDNICGFAAQTLMAAHTHYGEAEYRGALLRLGDFLVRSQMPEPQPGWAQQYNFEMKPVWARKFEPPAIASDETQEAIATLLDIHRYTGEDEYLAPIGPALEYLERSELGEGQLARFYELRTNRPLYMFRRGGQYALTYDDADLPGHYAWKIQSKVDPLRRRFERARRADANGNDKDPPPWDWSAIRFPPPRKRVRAILDSLDERGRWLDTYQGESLVGARKFKPGQPYLSSKRFAGNVRDLAAFLYADKTERSR